MPRGRTTKTRRNVSTSPRRASKFGERLPAKCVFPRNVASRVCPPCHRNLGGANQASVRVVSQRLCLRLSRPCPPVGGLRVAAHSLARCRRLLVSYLLALCLRKRAEMCVSACRVA